MDALKVLKTGANVFLTGEPGSGKTHTINQYIKYLRDYDIEPAVTASTGIAATHIGGLTIHAWSGIGVKRELTEYDLDKIMQNERVVKRVRTTRVLIIDEISMLSAGTLTMVDQVCRSALRKPSLAFGGMQVILVGDFFQLPPVVRRNDDTLPQLGFTNIDTHSQFAFESPSWKSLNPLVCYLSEQHRQEDATFAKILSSLRSGTMTDTHHAHLQKRIGTSTKSGGTTLFPRNADVDRINESELDKIHGTLRMYSMTSSGNPNLIEHLKRGCLSPEKLSLKIGARVMFTRNDQERQYVNGTTGTISGFETGSLAPMVKTVSGKLITVEKAEWVVESEGKKLASITQYPLRLAWAITVHKSQGISLDSAVIDLSQAFEYGQGYVALSRVRTLKSLTLLGVNKRAFEVHPEVRNKDESFRTHSHKVAQHFTHMSKDELSDMHAAFIKACRDA